MKRLFSLILLSIVLLSLCACDKNSNQNIASSTTSNQAATDNTDESIDSTAETTQAATEEPTTAPTTESTNAPTEEPTTKPPETPATKPTEIPTAPTACSHSYKDATCTAPKTCTKCGVAEGNAAGHSYKDATCTAPQTCAKCGTTEGRAVGHNWKNATCTTAKVCSICNTTEGNTTEHQYDNGECSVCGKEDIVNPQEYFKPVNYISIEKQEDKLTTIALKWNGESYDYRESWYSKNKIDNPLWEIIEYEGETFYPLGYCAPRYSFKLTNSYVEFYDPGNSLCAKYILQHDGSLRLDSLTSDVSTFPQLWPVGNLYDFVQVVE